ncbi:MAG TPA: hypothetical protein VKE96_32315 [Vicinamibacterales bacterium]|nr:hypothetical protein [Vicinamibacterales bacterium]
MPHEHDDELAPLLEQRPDGESEATDDELEREEDEEFGDDAIVGQ